MVKKILIGLGLSLLLLVTILLVNTFRARPWPANHATLTPAPLPDSAVQHLSRAIQLPTLSLAEGAAIDTAAFTRFGDLLAQSYPLVHRHLTKTMINQFSFIFEWQGQEAGLAPFVLMGHYDVVPAEAATLAQWKVPPFSGAVQDHCIWGRGAVDDKVGVIAILEATEALLQKGFTPRRTIYLCFGHDEELRGPSARAIAQYLQAKKVKPELVLDEGGQVVEEKMKEVSRPVALVGVAEKGYASFELSVHQEGGHSSMPARETAIDILSGALHRLRSQSPPARITPPVRTFLQRTGASADNFLHRVAGANLWLFEGIAGRILSTQPEGYAMSHTTIVPVILESGVKENVVPAIAKAIVNSRLLPGDTEATVEAYIRTAIGDDRVTITRTGTSGSAPSSITSTSSPAFRRVESAINKHVPNAVVSPFLVIGATDSRHYRILSDGVVNFMPFTDVKGFHGINERLPISDLQRVINFMTTILEEGNQPF